MFSDTNYTTKNLERPNDGPAGKYFIWKGIKGPGLTVTQGPEELFPNERNGRMLLKGRLAQSKDLNACLDLIQNSCPRPAAFQGQYLPFLEYLLHSGSWVSAVVEDEGRMPGKRLVGFAACLFIPDNFVRQIKTGLHPDLPLSLLEKWRLGLKPFLCQDGIGKANAGEGIAILALHFNHVAADCATGEQDLIGKWLADQLRLHLEGYRVKEWLAEVRGTKNRRLAWNMGLHPYRIFDEEKNPTSPNHPKRDTQRFLMGFQPGISPERPGTLVSSLSLFSPPRFYFSFPEQEVLREALQNETDEEIGPLIGISSWAVKKRWQGIYRKVVRVDRELTAADPAPDVLEASRVKQKRRRLLNYLRSHPEELRPLLPAKQGKKKGNGQAAPSRTREKELASSCAEPGAPAFTPKGEEL